jgi:hypothetical protein
MSEISNEIRTRVRGEDWPISATFRDASTGAVLDLSAYAATVSLKSDRDESTTYAISPVTATCSALGVISATMPKASTALLAPGDYWCEIERVGGGFTRKSQFRVRVVARVKVT